jgi:hypothetical protein
LQNGDVLSVEIDGIGVLTDPARAGRLDAAFGAHPQRTHGVSLTSHADGRNTDDFTPPWDTCLGPGSKHSTITPSRSWKAT